jgi:UDP:flavonoid glycosyltransferase YjiC (YdhE family)
VTRALRRILRDESYARAAARVAGEARALDGQARAATLIEERLSVSRRNPETTEGGLTPAPLPNGGL